MLLFASITQYKVKNNELKKDCIKNITRYYFDDIIKLKDFDLDNVLIDDKSYKNMYDFFLCEIDSIKYMIL